MTWAGIIGTHIIGPYFFENSVNTDTYLEMLEEFAIPELRALGYDIETIWFQHDGAPAHRALDTRDWLSAHFRHWIGIGGTIHWPARSPDFNPLDFFLWGALKNAINRIRPPNINALKTLIQETIGMVREDSLQAMHTNLQYRLLMCQAVQGGHFEQLL